MNARIKINSIRKLIHFFKKKIRQMQEAANINSSIEENTLSEQLENKNTAEYVSEINTSESTQNDAENAIAENNNAENSSAENNNSEIEEWKDRYLRLLSDFDNYKKRTLREKEQMIQFANEKLLLAFMPVIDDLIRTLKAAETTDNLESIRSGIALVYKNFVNALEKESVIAVPSVGAPFNSELHEAIASAPATEEYPKGIIVDEVEKGYTFHGKVIRFAKVVVAE
jgi:molecular chaperone GrpE